MSVAKVLVQVLTTAIGHSFEPAVAKSVKMGSGISKNVYALDKLQQYSHRENMRIAGKPKEEGENLRKKNKEIGQKVGVNIHNADINVVHRSGLRGARPRIVLV